MDRTAWWPVGYNYDPAGNITSVTENGTTTDLGYNAANELTSAGSTTYSYDADGNLTSASNGLAIAYNALNQATSITPPGGTTYAYDPRHQRCRPLHRISTHQNRYPFATDNPINNTDPTGYNVCDFYCWRPFWSDRNRCGIRVGADCYRINSGGRIHSFRRESWLPMPFVRG